MTDQTHDLSVGHGKPVLGTPHTGYTNPLHTLKHRRIYTHRLAQDHRHSGTQKQHTHIHSYTHTHHVRTRTHADTHTLSACMVAESGLTGDDLSKQWGSVQMCVCVCVCVCVIKAETHLHAQEMLRFRSYLITRIVPSAAKRTVAAI